MKSAMCFSTEFFWETARDFNSNDPPCGVVFMFVEEFYCVLVREGVVVCESDHSYVVFLTRV